eukprot:13419998-Alexandrium_andersonii.AAC.1
MLRRWALQPGCVAAGSSLVVDGTFVDARPSVKSSRSQLGHSAGHRPALADPPRCEDGPAQRRLIWTVPLRLSIGVV